MVIGINAGHTISGPGSGIVGYINESTETRVVAAALRNKLKSMGHTVIQCDNDYANTTQENLNAIVNKANAQDLDLFISIHFNGGGGKGVECWTYNGKMYDEAIKICDNIHALGFVNRSIKDGSNLAVVRRTKAKAILVECCFADTKSDYDLYQACGAEAVANAIATAIAGNTATGPVEYDKINDIIWELNHRGILTDTNLWIQKASNDINVYWLMRKMCNYVRGIK